MLQKWLVSVGGEYFPQPLLARQIGKWAGVGGESDGTVQGDGGGITTVNCLSKDNCPEVCSGNVYSRCLLPRGCPGQVPDSTAGS